MPQNLDKVKHILKDKYLPALENQLSTEPTPLLQKISKRPLTNDKIVAAAPIGLNGGFGFGAEGLNTPTAGAQRYTRFELESVDMYVDIGVSHKTVMLANNDIGSMIKVLDGEVRGAYNSASWNIGRALFGNGLGKLATVTSLSGAGTTVTISDTSLVKEGIKVDFYTTNAAVGSTPAKSGVRILAIDRVDNKIIVDQSYAYPAGFITLQNSYGRELCGLGAIIDPTITSLYGVSKADNPWIIPTVVDCKNDISDVKLYDGVKKAFDYKNAKIDMILMGDNAWKAYDAYIKENRTIIAEQQDFLGGITGHKVAIGSNKVVIVNEHFVPINEAWGVDTSSIHFDTTPLEFADYEGSPFQLKENTSIYRALLAQYGNLMCDNPGGCVQWTNCNNIT